MDKDLLVKIQKYIFVIIFIFLSINEDVTTVETDICTIRNTVKTTRVWGPWGGGA